MNNTWGPATPLMLLWENENMAAARWFLSDLSLHLYHRKVALIMPFVLRESTLRRRAMYGGRKGRAAIRRLLARGAKPMGGV